MAVRALNVMHLLSVGRLRQHPDVIELLEWPLDFILDRTPDSSSWFNVDGVPHEKVAEDGSGNVFAFIHEPECEGALLYVCHEGQAGVIAKDLREAIELFVEIPYWRDLLKFSGGGQLENMRRVVPFLEREMHEDEPSIENARRQLRSALGLSGLPDPVELLHRNVATFDKSVRVLSSEQEPFESLFNRFVVEDNPMWRNRAP